MNVNRTPRATRLLDMYLLLKAARYGYTLEELAERYDVTPRTIRRDLQEMESDPIYATVLCRVRREWRIACPSSCST